MAKFNWDKLKEDVKKSETKKSYAPDPRFWKPTLDKDGKAMAIIRFLPDQNSEAWAKFYTHNFTYMNDGVKKFWIKNCINTFGFDQECPICKKNMEYWNSSFENDKKLAGQRGRRLQFISNILVIKDPACPDHEGQIFLYQYGQKVYNKLKQRLFPSPEDLLDDEFKEYVPMDPMEGANFKLVVTRQGEFPNYDTSSFSSQSELFGGDTKKIDAIIKKTYDLSEFMDLKLYPTNEETIKALGPVLGLTTAVTPKVTNEIETDDDTTDTLEETKPTKTATAATTDDEDEDEDLKYFASLK